MSRIWLVLALGISVGCASGGDEVGSGALPLTPVTWTNVVGASAVGNDLTKTASGTLWNVGASSVETLTGDGHVEFTTGEATTAKACGLGSGDASQHYGDLELAIRLGDGGSVAVLESGSPVFSGGSYQAGDVFRVQVLGGVVSYWQNGAVFYTSAAQAPAFPLVVDTSLRTPGATISEVAIESLVFWKGVKRALAVGNDLVKTDPGTTWNAGAVSIAKLDGDGYVGFTTAENDADKIAGLSHQNGGPGFADIDFGVYLRANGRIAVYEAGVNRGGFGKYVAGDVFRVQVAGGEVSYWKNGNRFYTSAVAPVFPLLLDTSLRTPGATIADGVVVSGLGDEVCLVEAQTLTGEESGSLGFGMFSVDAAPGLMVVGARSGDPPLATVYRQGPSGWQLEQALPPPDGIGNDYPWQVATDGQTIAASDPYGRGTIFVFRHDGQEWVVDGLLDGCPTGIFEGAVAVRGDRLLVGGSRAYVFRRGPGGWIREAMISVPESPGPSGFPPSVNSVALGGDRIFLGVPYSDSGGTWAGAVYVYRRGDGPSASGTCADPSPGAWQLETVLHPSNAKAYDHFARSGIDSNLSGTQVIVGNEQYGYYTDWPDFEYFPNGLGTAHLFSLTPRGWQETFKLEPSFDPANPPWEGAMFGDHLAFGGPDPDSPSFVVVGAGEEEVAWVFRAIGGGSWNEVERIDGLGGSRVPVAATEDSAIVRTANKSPFGAVTDYDVLECPAP